MKFFSVLRTLTCIFVSLLSFALNAGTDIVLSNNTATAFTIRRSTYEQLKATNTFDHFSYSNVATAKGNFAELFADGYSKTNVVGEPQLPVLSRLIELPAGATPKVIITSYEVHDYALADWGITQKIMPVQPPVSKNATEEPQFLYNQAAYNQNKFFGGEPVHVEIQGYLRNMRLANLVISPVQYNPVTGIIRVYSNIEFAVEFENADIQKTQEINTIYGSPYFNTPKSNIAFLPQQAKAELIIKNPVKYVIVSHPMFREALQPFVYWKTKKGFQVIEAYTDNSNVGSTTTAIKSYLQNLYTSATTTDPAPSFILFVGDVAQMPTFLLNRHATDLPYCEYTGDNLPEVYYGRFSATNVAELQPQIDKTLEYEQFLFPDPSFLNEVVMISGHDASFETRWSNGQVNYGTTHYFNQAHGLTSHTYLQPEPSGANYAQNIQNNISAGVGYVNYSAHGFVNRWEDPLFTNSHVGALQNKHKYPLMVGNCCQSSTYNQYCFGEALMRAQDKGALGYIGASDLTYWDEDYWWSVGVGPITSTPIYETHGLGAYARTFHDRGEPYSEWYTTMGQMVVAGNLAVQESNTEASMKQHYWEIYNLLGDPSLSVYFSNPQNLQVSHNSVFDIKNSQFEIQTEPYAYVGLSKNGILYAAGQANASGKTIIEVTANLQYGYASLVVTKQNRKPYIDSVLIGAPNSSYLALKQTTIADQQGNNNQIAENNEEISFNFMYENFGAVAATNATAALSSTDPYITIIDSVAVLPTIARDSVHKIQKKFRVKIASGIPDQHEATFTVVTKSESETTTASFSITVNAPKLIAGDIQLVGLQHPLAPGDMVNVSVPISNIGHAPIEENIIAALFSFSSDITVQQRDSKKNERLGISENSTLKFQFSISPSCTPNKLLNLYFTASNGEYSATAESFPYIGQQIENFETKNFKKYNWQMDSIYPWRISTADKQDGSYSARSAMITHNKRSDLWIDVDVFVADSISFYIRSSSQAGGDFMEFSIDGIVKEQVSGNNTTWSRLSCAVPQGKHRFMWSYVKNASESIGYDACWIDCIQFPSFYNSAIQSLPLKSKVFATSDTICQDQSSQLLSAVTKSGANIVYQWSPATGLNRANIPNPIATPTATTTYKLLVIENGDATQDSVKLFVNAIPAAAVIALNTNNILTSNVAIGNQWYNSQGAINGSTGQSYHATQSDEYYCIITNAGGCSSEPSNRISFADAAQTPQSKILSAFPNPFKDKLTISYYLHSASKVKAILYNTLGMPVATIEELSQNQGNCQISFNSLTLPNSVYICKLITPDKIMVTKVIHSN